LTQENKDLAESVEVWQTDLEAERVSHSKMIQEYHELRGIKAGLDRSLEDLKVQLADREEAIKELESQSETSHAMFNDRLKQAELARENLVIAKDRVNAQLLQVKGESESLSKRVDELEALLSEKQDELAKANEEIVQLNKALDEEKSLQLEEKCQELNKQLVAREQELVGLKDQLDAEMAKYTETLGVLEKAKEQEGALEEQLGQVTRQLKESQEELNVNRSTLQNQMRSIQEQAEKIAKLESELKEKCDSLNSTMLEKNLLLDDVADMERSAQSLMQREKDHQAEIEALESRNTEQVGKIQELENLVTLV
jgi:chromosome segregation ATPase